MNGFNSVFKKNFLSMACLLVIAVTLLTVIFSIFLANYSASEKQDQLELSVWDNTRIEGSVDASMDGVMMTSVPFDAGWMVTVDGKEMLRRPLVMENSYEIEQEDGAKNVIRVEGGAVFMEAANCRDGLCIRQGKMKNAAKTIVCLPHKLVVQLVGDAPESDVSDLDVIIQ